MSTVADRSPIEDYLDALLLASLGAPPRATRNLLAESEAHLRDAADEAVAAGMSPRDAEEAAVSRFGPVESLVHAEAATHTLPLTALLRPAVGTTLLLGGLGGVALGVSAVITAVMGWLGGSSFIVNLSPGTHLATADCVRWLGRTYSSKGCYQAALQDWSFDIVAGRAAAGVLGVLALLAYAWLRRRSSGQARSLTLPRGPVDAAAFVVFGGAGVWLAGLGVDALIGSSGRGAGIGLGTAPAMLALGVWFGWRLVHDLRHDARPVMA